MAGRSPSPEPKQPLTLLTAFQEFTPESSNPRPRPTVAQHAHVAVTAIGAIFGLVIMATSADALRVFHSTHLGSEFHLPVWPRSFHLAPTIAGVVCGALVWVMNCVALVGQLVPALKRLPLSLPALVPLSIALIAAVVGTVIPFHALTLSTGWSVQSWSCQWSGIRTSTAPHWGTLCAESRAASILCVCVVPLNGLVVASILASMMRGQRIGGGERAGKGSRGNMS